MTSRETPVDAVEFVKRAIIFSTLTALVSLGSIAAMYAHAWYANQILGL